MMFWYDHDVSAWGWVLMSLSMVVFWALVIAGIVAAVRYAGRTPDRFTTAAAGSPEDVLADRYARGEIDEDEYQRRLQTLRESARGGPTPVSRT